MQMCRRTATMLATALALTWSMVSACEISSALPNPRFDSGNRQKPPLKKIHHPKTGARIIGSDLGKARGNSTVNPAAFIIWPVVGCYLMFVQAVCQDQPPGFVSLLGWLIPNPACILVMQECFPREGAATVAKLQLALNIQGSASSFPEALTRIVNNLCTQESHDPSSSVSLLTSEVAIELLKHENKWISAACVTQKSNRKAAEEVFKQYSIEERCRIRQETVIEIGKREPYYSIMERDPKTAERPSHMVVTLLLMLKDRQTFAVQDRDSFKQAILKLASCSSKLFKSRTMSEGANRQLLAAEIFWTPEDQTEVFDACHVKTYYSLPISLKQCCSTNQD